MKPFAAYYRNGKLQALDQSMKSLLIGYDMIPLIGLSAMKKRLAARGEFRRVQVVESKTAKTWALFRGQSPVRRFIDWQGGPSSSRAACALSALGCLADSFQGEAKETAKKLYYAGLLGRLPDAASKSLRLLAARGFRVARAAVVPEG